ncbi:MAG: hypothetical protein CEN87_105 [Parcubacteria group bacterium Licking1014_1]|nr:MAG: hypothetical protein CEN87_105 [Parcubacteria group bacterium Licking1014_1]
MNGEIKDTTPIQLFNISKIGNKKIENELLLINREWKDVQGLYNFFLCINKQLDIIDSVLFECYFDGMSVVIKDFYSHFSIIYKLLEKIKNNIDNKDIREIFREFEKNCGKNIQIIRNQIHIHKEGANFYKNFGTVFSRDDGGTLKIDTENGSFELKPLADFKNVELYLLKFKEIL